MKLPARFQPLDTAVLPNPLASVLFLPVENRNRCLPLGGYEEQAVQDEFMGMKGEYENTDNAFASTS